MSSSSSPPARPALQRPEGAAEVEIVGEHDVAVLACPLHQRAIGGTWIADIGPVNSLEARAGELLHPERREVHVDEDLHERPSGTSISSARQAAYASASRTSSSSR